MPDIIAVKPHAQPHDRVYRIDFSYVDLVTIYSWFAHMAGPGHAGGPIRQREEILAMFIRNAIRTEAGAND